MKFDEAILGNKLFLSTALSFNEAPDRRMNDVPDEAGVHVQENGDVVIDVYAPGAKEVSVFGAVSRTRDFTLRLTKKTNGIFEGLHPYREDITGPVTLIITVDGSPFLDPYIPINWTGNQPMNYVEIPDKDMDYLLIRDVPHGALCREIYWVEATQNWERCYVYTPPGYMNRTDSYPVLYLQNGGGDNEICWEITGRMSTILDNLLAKKECVPFLVVMNNTMLRGDGHISDRRDRAYESLLKDSCIPYIENHYRVKSGKWNRAIAGLSMGSYMSCDIAFWNPDLFGHLGQFTAGMTTLEKHEMYERPYPEVMAEGAEKFGEKYHTFFRSTTEQEDHFDWFEADDRICAETGIDQLPGYYRIAWPDTVSKWNSWRMGFREFAKVIFR